MGSNCKLSVVIKSMLNFSENFMSKLTELSVFLMGSVVHNSLSGFTISFLVPLGRVQFARKIATAWVRRRAAAVVKISALIVKIPTNTFVHVNPTTRVPKRF